MRTFIDSFLKRLPPLWIYWTDVDQPTTQRETNNSEAKNDSQEQPKWYSSHSNFIRNLLKGLIPTDHDKVLEKTIHLNDSIETKKSRNASAGILKKKLVDSYRQQYRDLHSKSIKSPKEEQIYQQLRTLLKDTLKASATRRPVHTRLLHTAKNKQ